MRTYWIHWGLLTLGIFVLTGCPSQQQTDQFAEVYANGYFEHAIFCGPSNTDTPQLRRQGMRWEDLYSVAETRRLERREQMQQIIQRLRAQWGITETDIEKEKSKYLQELRDLAPETTECFNQNRLTYSEDEAALAQLLFDQPFSAVDSSEGVEAFVDHSLIPRLEATQAQVVVLGEDHTDQNQRLFQTRLLEVLAHRGVRIAWVAHEYLQLGESAYSQALIKDFEEMSEPDFQVRVVKEFPYDGDLHRRWNHQLGLRHLFLTLHRLHHQSEDLFKLIPLDRRSSETFWSVITFQPAAETLKAFHYEDLRSHVNALGDREIGIIITGASHASLDPEDLRDIAAFRAQVTSRVLTLLPVSYHGVATYTPSLQANDEYLPQYLGHIDMKRLYATHGLFPLAQLRGLKDLQRLLNKLAYNNALPLGDVHPETVIPLIQRIRSQVFPVGKHPTVVDTHAHEFTIPASNEAPHPITLADYFYFY